MLRPTKLAHLFPGLGTAFAIIVTYSILEYGWTATAPNRKKVESSKEHH
jgi:hypothetical protein